MTSSRLGFLSFLSLTLAAATLPAQQPLLRSDAQVGRALQSLESAKAELGLGAEDAFAFRSAHVDELRQAHARFQQTYQGLPVWGGEVITHADAEGRALAPTRALYAGIRLNTTPSIGASEALAIVHGDLAPKGPYDHEPSAVLVVFPIEATVRRAGLRPGAEEDATAFENQVVRYALAWHVRADLRNGVGETRSQHYFIDAHTGAILKSWNGLETAGAVGTGVSQWYGTVSLNTNTVASGYEMRDTTRGNTTVVGGVGNATTNLNHKTSGVGTIYTDADDAWGDGNGYGSGTTTSTTGATGQTAAVDAHHGLQATWDFYKNIFNRNGIDNTGKATYSRMHYSSNYDNAFWDDTCFCMTYGDGNPPSGSYGEADLDTAGHEMSHGVCAAEANLNYSGESGGLNESDSDIMGTCVEFYTLGGGTGSTIPDSASIQVNGHTVSANYTMFENSWGHPGQALRYMYRPDLDGGSANYWYSTVGSLDVHYSSGPNNRFFYFLAAGATATGDTSTSVNTAGNGVSNPNFLPNGMNGIGNDEADRIWYRTLTTYLTSSSNYAAARTAAISAATDLYGANSFEVYAVQNAYHGINVGAAATATAVKVSFLVPASDITVNSGDTIEFDATVAKDTDPSVAIARYNWNFGNGTTGTSTGTGYPYAYTNTGTSDAAYTVSLTATDANGATSPAVTRQVTVHPATSDTQAPVAGMPTVSAATGIIAFAGSATDNVGVTKMNFYLDGALYGSRTVAPYKMGWNSKLKADGPHTLYTIAYDAANNAGTSPTLTFSTDNTAPTGACSETGAKGAVFLIANPADNVGVTKVVFYLDGVLYGTKTAAPYKMGWNSALGANGSHTLSATAYDAAGNAGSLAPVTFTIAN